MTLKVKQVPYSVIAIAVVIDGECNHNGETHTEFIGISYDPENERAENICDHCEAIL